MVVRTRIVAAIVPAALLLVACGTGGAQVDAGGEQADSEEAVAQSACYVSAAASHPYATPANEAIQAAADEAGVDLTVLSQEFDAQQGTEQLSTCIGQGADGIILWPLDADAYLPQMAQAQEAGIPILLVNTPMSEDAAPYYTTFTGPDTYQQGELTAQLMHEALDGEGDIVIIAGQAGNPTTIGRTDGFVDELEAMGSDINILETVNADFDQQAALVASRDLITRHGDKIDGVYAEDDTMALGWHQALAESDLDGTLPMVGINGQQEAFEMIRNGEMYGTILQSPDRDGRLAMETLLEILAGEQVESRIPLDLEVITSENVDDFEPAF